MNKLETVERFPTHVVQVGEIALGGSHPIVVQTMATEHTSNIEAVAKQIAHLHYTGAEIVRVAVANLHEASCIPNIKRSLKKHYRDVPLVADIHHQGGNLAVEVAKTVDKVRINPGLFVFKKPTGRIDEYTQVEIEEELAAIDQSLEPVLAVCHNRGVPMRIGVNHGSLSERMKVTYGNTPKGMVESAMEYLQICEHNGFKDLVISLKASNVPVMIAANRLMVSRMKEEGMNYPLHLGVTEAGAGQYGRVKGVAGIATLLSEGIGDTIRVSLSEDPLNELSVCYDLLQSLKMRQYKMEPIACPTCSRTRYDLPSVFGQVEKRMTHLKHLSIAVMGCVVNGPGEMEGADYGILGQGDNATSIYKGKNPVVKNVPQEQAVDALEQLIRYEDRWLEQQDKPPFAWEE